METVDLTSRQNDYAIFLPAISNAFTSTVGKSRHDPNYFAPTRVPQGFEYGIDGLDWLKPKDRYFNYKWNLYSAGHANLDVNKFDASESMVRERDRASTWLLGDSGGFQIGKGVWEGDWANPSCPKAQKKREQVLKWMDTYMDYGMVLDVPVWIERSAFATEKTGVRSYQDAVDATNINNDYFMKNRTGACKFLNVLQGETHTQAANWYETMKHYCDPTQHENHFNGWAMGGQNMCDIHLTLKRIITIMHDGLLEKGKQDWMHFLGTSKLEWATLLTDLQRAVRKYHNANFTISFDCASPFLAAANGQVYREIVIEDKKKWTYRMEGGLDNKKYAQDTRALRQAVLDDKIYSCFEDSPVTARCQIKDICTYAPGDLNKIGKEGKTSWDTLTYNILMAHNTYMHIESVQRGNRMYDQGIVPDMLVNHDFDLISFRQLVDEIFSLGSLDQSLQLIEDHSRYWMDIIGTRGMTGKKTSNGKTFHSQFFVKA